MATSGWGSTRALSETLFDEGFRFEFFQAVRLLQQADTSKTPVGTGDDPAREAVRFRSDCSFRFPTADLDSVSRAESPADAARMLVNFMGVASQNSFGSLPYFYTELATSGARGEVPVWREFLDLFNHRLISLFYRAWQKHRFPVAFESAGASGLGLFENALLSLLGMGTPALQGRLPFNDLTLVSLAAHLRRKGAPAAVVSDLVSRYFDIPVSVSPITTSFHYIEESERSRLGRTAHQLGATLTLGTKVRVTQSSVRLRLGPLTWDQYQEYLPGGAGHAALLALLELAVGPEYDFEFVMVLAAQAVPKLRLGVAGEEQRCRLGWSSWLCTEPLVSDPADVTVHAEAC